MFGYRDELEQAWKLIREALNAKGIPNLARRPTVLEKTIQRNGEDCGIFVLAKVRWRLEGWPPEDLTQDNMPLFRQRILLDLERWNLT